MPDAPGVSFTDVNMAVAAALAGQGVVLGDTFSCAAAMAEGRLVAPSPVTIPSGNGYAIVLPDAAGAEPRPALAALLGWLDEELAAEGRA